MSAVYDAIGQRYALRRRADPRIAAMIETALGDARSVLNVGAGAGSYESTSREVLAVEPSWTMIAQRPAGAAAAIQARAEALPIRSGAFDAVTAILTVHHWTDLRRGLAECRRAAHERIVILTIDMEVCARFWLYEYFPEMFSMDRDAIPGLDQVADLLGSADVRAVPIPSDCRDGFLGAYWKRPEAYLDPAVRAGISSFSKCGSREHRLRDLRQDVESGEWARRYASVAHLNEMDLGYRLVIAAP
jgi:SAM-dependent methyltransferase